MTTLPVIDALTVDLEEQFQVSAFEAHVGRHDWPRFERRVGVNTDRLLEIFDGADARIGAAVS